jgi:transcription initiation factor TFIID subunit TAF12
VAGDDFDTAITEFCQRYADQNEQDYQDFDAVRDGRIDAVEGI